MARGRLRSGSRTSPPTAAIRSKPWSAMNVNPIAWTSPPGPAGRNGSSRPSSSDAGAPSHAHAPPAISIAKTSTLPTVAAMPPPPALRTSASA